MLATRTVVVLPELSEGMGEGTVLEWLVADGDEVAAGQPVVEVETDKATTELEANADGRLWQLVPAGDTVAVRSELAVIGPERPSAAAPSEPSAPASPPARADDGRRQLASPVARRVARELGVDLSRLQGSGMRGRIRRADVLAAVAAPAPEPAPVIAPPERREPVTPTRVQLRIAERMVQAKTTIPDFAVSMTVDMDAATEMRGAMRAHADRSGTRPPSVNDMVIKACALALREHPEVNSSFVEDAFLRHAHVNVGVAVATEGSLLVPTIADADVRSLGSIAQESRRLAGAVRDGTIAPAELAGGTFTVSNLGMFGVSGFTAVVNPPQAAILAVGAVEEAAVVRDGALTVGRRMHMTLTCDHRIVYGAAAAAFLSRVRELLELPWGLVL
jgi:pyruvate dehydrogenase E2 component (dihydrolipoyllysine-residue acetyltransferase)